MNVLTPRFAQTAPLGAIDVTAPVNPPLSDAEQLIILHRQSQKPPDMRAN